MKKIKFTLLSVFAVMFLFSCSSDDDNKGIDTTKLLGKWYYYSITDNGVEELYDHDGSPQCGEDYMNFKSNGTLDDVMFEHYSQCHSYIDQAVYSVSGNTLTITFIDEDEEEESTYVCTVRTLNDDTLILELYGDKVKFVRDVNLITD